ncbi:glycosyltransferase family 39 protein [Candidatus Microgenomates bacterium]|nr:glycosyltransferase family 39 protein [Candidatus Microgenomates bacterium]
MAKIFQLKNTTTLTLIGILLLAAFFRFYRLPEMANFDFDQEYTSNFAYAVLREFPIQLIGQGLSVEGLFMGPLYFYYLVPFFAITNLHPIGGFVASVILGLIIIVAFFWVASSLFGKTAGLIAAFLRAILFIEIDHDWTMVPSYSSELLVLITWYCFYKYWQGQTKFLPLLGLSFGLYTSIHPILFPFYLVFIFLLIFKKLVPKLKTIILSLACFLIPVLPLIIFEYLHSFWEVKKLFSFFSGSSGGSLDVNRLMHYAEFNLLEANRILNIQFLSSQIFIILFLIIIFLLIRNKVGFWKDSFHKIMLAATWVIFIVYYTILPTHVSEYYFLGLTTLTLLYLAGTLSLLAKKTKLSKLVLILILVNITIFNFGQLRERWLNPSLVTLVHKDDIVKEIIKRQDNEQEFYVSYIPLPGWTFGFNYLFKYYEKMPQTREVKPPVYTIVIPKYLSPDSIDVSSGNIGLILPD